MSTQLIDRGFERDDLFTILETMRLDVLRIYPEANLDPATKDGQLLGTFSNAIDQLGQVMQAVYDSGSPSTASGVTLARIVEYNGIRIINGTQSSSAVVFTGNVGAVVPRNSNLRCTVNNTLFYTLEDCTITSSGSGMVNVLASEVGATAAPANTITQMMMPIFSVRSVTNPHDAVIGQARETDYALRLRRAFSVATPSQSILEGIKGAVADLPNVTQVQTYENKTDVTNAYGLPPHSFSVVVQGGADDAIAHAIFEREPVGSGQYGDVTVMVDDQFGFHHYVTFMRPPVVPIWMRIEVRVLAGWEHQMIAAIQDNIVAWMRVNSGIGEPVIRSRLYIPINAAGNTFAVFGVLLGTSPNDLAHRDFIEVPFNGIAVTDSSQIEVVGV
jgi:uncharacterized phage protein gp47/JayE